MNLPQKTPRSVSTRWARLYLAYEHRIPNHPGKRTLMRLLLRMAARLCPRPFPWRMRNGVVLAIAPADGLGFPGTVGWTCFRLGLWEPHVERRLRELLRPGDVALDIGANLGYFATVMAQSVEASGKVLAFEPVPKTWEQLRLAAAFNGFTWMTPLAMALGSSEGYVELAVDATNTGNASIHRSATAEGHQLVRAPMRRLDDVLSDAETPPPALIKIDVEGHEFEVLQGARETLARGRPAILFEYAPELANRAGWQLRDMGRLIGLAGQYDFCLVNEDGLEPIDVDRWMPDPDRYAVDVLARPRQRGSG